MVMRAREKIPILSGPISDWSLKHNGHPILTSCPIHHHFELEDDRRTAEKDGKAGPSKILNGIHAPDWMFSDENLCTNSGDHQPARFWSNIS